MLALQPPFWRVRVRRSSVVIPIAAKASRTLPTAAVRPDAGRVEAVDRAGKVKRLRMLMPRKAKLTTHRRRGRRQAATTRTRAKMARRERRRAGTTRRQANLAQKPPRAARKTVRMTKAKPAKVAIPARLARKTRMPRRTSTHRRARRAARKRIPTTAVKPIWSAQRRPTERLLRNLRMSTTAWSLVVVVASMRNKLGGLPNIAEPPALWENRAARSEGALVTVTSQSTRCW
mmetsp:Transcript_90769/g.256314  ORF Transcript_90769/g.256314 Transcript_90769/m.256314 type:complete len:232 (-) Transcript_90769:342-1037(-)